MSWRLTRWGQGTAVIGLCLIASLSWGQETPPSTRDQPPVTEPAPALPTPGPSIAAYPLELFSLLLPARGGVTLTPSIAISEEYNDNIFSDNQNRQWDFITNATPGITLVVNRASYQLGAGYASSGQIYARESRFNSALESQHFVAFGSYRPTPQLTLTGSDSFTLDRNTNVVGGFSTGRQKSWGNTFTPAMTWQMTPSNSLNLSASYGVLRFEGAGEGRDSDTYGVQGGFGHTFTPRLTGTIGYGFGYLDSQRQQSSSSHTPTLGFSYRFTPTLTGSVSGGASITEIGGETFVSPAGTATLLQTLRFGSIGVQYTRGVSVAGGFGGTTDTQTVSGTVALTTLQRGLVLVFGPAYSTAKSVSNNQTGQVEVWAATLNLGVAYQISRFATVFGGYTFFMQRTGGSSSLQSDVDQNRVRFGLQLGYPINFN